MYRKTARFFGVNMVGCHWEAQGVRGVVCTVVCVVCVSRCEAAREVYSSSEGG
jgi:hypothetical protein